MKDTDNPWRQKMTTIDRIIFFSEVKDEQKNLYRKAIYKTTMDYLDAVKDVKPFGTRLKAPGEEYYDSFYWKAMVEYVKERDGYKCSVCGSSDDLEVHHILRRADGGSNNPVNLILLCRKCHDDIHHNDRKRCYTYLYESVVLNTLERHLKIAYNMFVCGSGIQEGDKKYIEDAYNSISELADIIRSRDESHTETNAPFKKPKTRQIRLGEEE